MKSLMMPIQLALQCIDARGGGLTRTHESGSLTGSSLTEAVELTADRTRDGLAVAREVDDRHETLSEALGLETLLHHAKRRLLLADD